MAVAQVPPQLGLESFSCPHCGALSHQTWFKVFVDDYKRGEKPGIISYDELKVIDFRGLDDDEQVRMKNLRNRLRKNVVAYLFHQYGHNVSWEVVNVAVSECYSCKAFAIWVEDRVIYPEVKTEIVAHDEMPAEIKGDFEEAGSIVDKSPRGAAALLRLCIQKLMPVLGEKGENINKDIAELVQKGLEGDIQKAMDILRVIGNNAVHPGQIDLKDDEATALKLFELLNLIVERRIATPKKIKALFGELPEGAREAIEKRDAPKEG